MARVRRYMNRINGWEQASAAVVANAADLAHLEVPQKKLVGLQDEVRKLSAQQSALTASRQETTKRLQQALREGDLLADLLRSGVREHYGPNSEKLVEFGMQPFRGRKKKEPKEPEEPTSKPPVEPGSTPAPDSAQ